MYWSLQDIPRFGIPRYHSFSTIQIHPVCHNTYFNTLFETSSKSSNVFLDTWSQIGICRGYNTKKKLTFMEIKHHHVQLGENFKPKIYLKNKVVSIISIFLWNIFSFTLDSFHSLYKLRKMTTRSNYSSLKCLIQTESCTHFG